MPKECSISVYDWDEDKKIPVAMNPAKLSYMFISDLLTMVTSVECVPDTKAIIGYIQKCGEMVPAVLLKDESVVDKDKSDLLIARCVYDSMLIKLFKIVTHNKYSVHPPTGLNTIH